jgi:DnaA family protein
MREPERGPATASPQLALRVGLDDQATLDNFLRRDALASLLAALEQAPTAEPLSFLHGAAESGKSHLLQALCHAHPGAMYLPLGSLAGAEAGAVLQDLESAPLLALDEVQAIAGSASWEEALFHLCNRARASGCALWVAGRRPAGDLGIVLPDLRSRLAGGVTWALPPCSDTEKAAILRFRAGRRGLKLSDAVIRFLIARDSRALGDLLATLDRLDRASLQLQRPLTVPLVKDVMGW